MAVVQFTGIVNQVRGKLNGSVFNKSRNANTLQRKQQQTLGSKGFQSEIRNIFSDVQRNWKTTTPSEKNDWQSAAQNNPSRDRFGNQTILSGYNQYIKANIFREYSIGLTAGFVDPLPAPAGVLTSFFITDLVFTVSPTGRVTVDYEFNIASVGEQPTLGIIIDISLPVSQGVTNYYKRYTFIHGNEYGNQTIITGSQDLGTKFPMPRATQRVIARCRIVYNGNGAVVQEFFDDKIF